MITIKILFGIFITLVIVYLVFLEPKKGDKNEVLNENEEEEKNKLFKKACIELTKAAIIADRDLLRAPESAAYLGTKAARELIKEIEKQKTYGRPKRKSILETSIKAW